MGVDLATALRRRAYEMDRYGTFTTNRPTPELLTDAAAEIERLRAALAPFAAFANEPALMARTDDYPVWGHNDTTFTVGDVRRAAEALAAAGEGTSSA